ncbi:bifunctional phosphopantothenoylcysteine decarboxylase/phosphopantothenate--cysteine ligase CoaBC [Biformimicrobium ophioploci]|uniref:Coenzyme A biosynthesis bifunctional protein CoaBC n=1 Tax=Biformimicrobium ophioploci TaxID=3036711 RepID=A0ABQ6LVQ1_9GAMM|nr:bifunctional phosphopantothenoylcysteine decarboxylase/phosphopantothenate--cysteine ligase CoaBC [Microbulbifer sp. NKW57]GMG86169.1 bifunctional phosphopantothenoylcysteine decarboxylase/phosphopantothenate--cysteine ligase CoaBC [Microbulbifer sp. NKW57]
MAGLAGKRLLLGVTGGIAAYKSADLVRKLRTLGAEVRVVMTRGATAFVQPLTFQALSGNPVHTDLLDPDAEAAMGHIELAKWADLILVAPASANTLARLRTGMADDLLGTVCLATEAPLALAPAMNQAMWRHPAALENASALAARGVELWGPDDGSQACGDVGPGRMLEPVELAERAARFFARGDAAGLHIAITAGPTREPLDPVRYISNHSSGKMGFALAQAAERRGARVTLIAGPVNLPTPAGVERVDVGSAQEMAQAAERAADSADIFIGAAAVADFRPDQAAEHKIKKEAGVDNASIALVKNPDIIAGISARKDRRPYTVGFAAETRDVARYAQDKLQRKNLDMIVANDVGRADIGFDSDSNQVLVIDRQQTRELPLALKSELAGQLLDLILQNKKQK